MSGELDLQVDWEPELEHASEAEKSKLRKALALLRRSLDESETYKANHKYGRGRTISKRPNETDSD
jgi:hypothetical protein